MATSTAIQIKDAAANVLFPRVRTSDIVTNDLAAHIFDANNKINTAYLPSYVDDVIDVEGAFLYNEIGPTGETSTVAIPAALVSNAYYLDGSAMKIRHTNGTASTNLDTGSALETGKIYVTSKGQQFRYTGTQLVPIVPFGANMGITTSMNHADGDSADNNPDNTLTTARAVARYTINKIANSTVANVTSAGDPITVTTNGRTKTVGLSLDSGTVNGVKIYVSGTKLKASAALTTGASNAYGTVAAWTTTDANVVAIAAGAAGSKYIVPTMQTLYAVKSALLTSIGTVDGAGLTSVLADAPIKATTKSGNSETISIDINSDAVNGVKVEVVSNKLKASAATASTTGYGTVKTVTTVAATAGADLVPTTSAVWTALAGKATATHSHTIANISNLQTNLDSKLNAANKATVHAIASGVNETTYVTPLVLTSVLACYNVRAIYSSLPTAANTPAGFFAVSGATSPGLYYAESAGVAGYKMTISTGTLAVWSNTSYVYVWNVSEGWGPVRTHWDSISGRPDFATLYAAKDHTHNYAAASHDHGHANGTATASGFVVTSNTITSTTNAFGNTSMVPTMNAVHGAITSLATAINGKQGTHSHPYVTSATVQGTNGVTGNSGTAGSVVLSGVNTKGDGTTIGVVKTATLAAASVTSQVATHDYTSRVVPTIQTLYNVAADLKTSIGTKAATGHDHAHANGNGASSGFVVTQSTLTSTTNAFGNTSLVPAMNPVYNALTSLQTAINGKAGTHTHPYVSTTWKATVAEIASGVTESTYINPKTLQSVLQFYNVRTVLSAFPAAANIPGGFWAISGQTSAGLYYTSEAKGGVVKVPITDGCTVVWSNTSLLYQWNSGAWGYACVHWNGISGKPDLASAGHTHAIADVTNLQTTLNGKAATGHDHAHANGTATASGFVVTSNTITSTTTAFGNTSMVPTMNAVHGAITSLASAIDAKQGTIASYVASVKGSNGISPTTAQTGNVTLSCTNANAGTGVGVVYTSNRIPTGAVNGDTTSVVPTLGVIRASCLFYTTL